MATSNPIHAMHQPHPLRCPLRAATPPARAANPSPQPPGPAADFPGLRFPPDRRTLRVEEVCDKLRVSKQHVVNLIEEGRLRAVNVNGPGPGYRRLYRIPVEAYDAFLRENLL